LPVRSHAPKIRVLLQLLHLLIERKPIVVEEPLAGVRARTVIHGSLLAPGRDEVGRLHRRRFLGFRALLLGTGSLSGGDACTQGNHRDHGNEFAAQLLFPLLILRRTRSTIQIIEQFKIDQEIVVAVEIL
jgi:hypothetical protein